MLCSLSALGLFLAPLLVSAHGSHEAKAEKDPWNAKFSGEIDLPFTGITTFAHLPHRVCLKDVDTKFDIAVIGVPFDSAVSFRPGARFGPYGIRSGGSAD